MQRWVCRTNPTNRTTAPAPDVADILHAMAQASHFSVAADRIRLRGRWWRCSFPFVATGVIWLLIFEAAPRTTATADQVAPRAEATADLSAAIRTRDTLARETPPARDEIVIARQFRGNACTDPMPTPVPMWQSAAPGEKRRFKVLDERKRTFLDVQATLMGASDHLLVYVQDGVAVAPQAIAAAVEAFEKRTLPVLEASFGPMPTPGRITVFSGQVPGVGGYFSSSDLVPASLSPNSNERAMVYVNSDVFRPGQAGFDGVLAHEVQHFLHWVHHSQQDSWFNEGASELAMVLTGHAQGSPVRSYTRKLDTPVTGWAERPLDAVPHYGAASLIVRYLGFRVGGNERLGAVIATPGVSTQVIDRYLAATNAPAFGAASPESDTSPVGSNVPLGTPPLPTVFDDLFADFIVATALDDPQVGDGRFAFGRDPVLTERPSPSERIDVTSGSSSTTAAQATTEGKLAPYGTRLIEIGRPPRGGRAPGGLEILLDGNAVSPAIGESPPGDGTFWWGYPADETFATLTRTVDLRDESSATLELDAWYDLEQDYDYAGVAVSTDGGCAWRAISGTETTDTNPIGHNPGHAWTGRSGGGEAARWRPMRFELRSAIGHVAMIRIFQINDQSFHRAGLAVTNLRVTTGDGSSRRAAERAGPNPSRSHPPTETTDPDWQARGFIATANRVAVTWAARVIVASASQTRVETIPMRPSPHARVRGALFVPASALDDNAKVTVALSPMAPATREATDFRLTVTSTATPT
jgi:hypothetical protein